MESFLKKAQGIKGYNIIWEKLGSEYPNEYIVLGANYDTLNIDKKTYALTPESEQPGADNNASSVSVLLSMIEILSELNLKRSVKIVFFDFGELDQLGLEDFYKKYLNIKSNQKVYSYLHLKMLGYDSKINDKEKRYGNMLTYRSFKGEPLYEREKEIFEELKKNSRFINTPVRFSGVEDDYIYPKSALARKANIPSLIYTQNIISDYNESRINTSKDFPETLNINTLYGSFKYLTSSVSHWLLVLSK